MKTIKLVVWISLFLGLIMPDPLWADDSQSMLVGHDKKEENLVKEAQAIFIGHFLSLGNGPGGDSAGMEYFDGAEVEIDQPLKGALSGKVTASYSVEYTRKERENNPETNKKYIFFIDILSPTQLSVVKILPATNQNVAKINALIAAAPAVK